MHRGRPQSHPVGGVGRSAPAAAARHRRRPGLGLPARRHRRGPVRPGVRLGEWTVGFDDLAARAAEYPARAGGGADRRGRRRHRRGGPHCTAGTHPASLAMGNGIELHHDGVQAARALACLQAVCGNLDVPGGGLLTMKNGLTPVVPPVAVTGRVDACGGHRCPRVPLLPRTARPGPGQPLRPGHPGRRAVPSAWASSSGGSNPLLQWPGVARLREAFDRLELLVVMDTSFTETTAHGRLRAAGHPAGGAGRGLGHHPGGRRAPPGTLARRRWSAREPGTTGTSGPGWPGGLGYETRSPGPSAREALDWRLAPLGVDAATLAAAGTRGPALRRALPAQLRARRASRRPAARSNSRAR